MQLHLTVNIIVKDNLSNSSNTHICVICNIYKCFKGNVGYVLVTLKTNTDKYSYYLNTTHPNVHCRQVLVNHEQKSCLVIIK